MLAKQTAEREVANLHDQIEALEKVRVEKAQMIEDITKEAKNI